MSETPIKIEKGIPIPPKKQKESIYPYKRMEVGDSFIAPRRTQTIMTQLADWRKRTGWNFTVRTIDAKTCRVWRTK